MCQPLFASLKGNQQKDRTFEEQLWKEHKYDY